MVNVIRDQLKKFRVYIRVLRHRIKGRQIVHFLHINKTGGTALKSALKTNTTSSKYHIVLHSHNKFLKHIPEHDKVFFVLRDPAVRFVSGFNCRKRKSLPNYFAEWSDVEKATYEYFPTANDLARALSSDVLEVRKRAEEGMRGIRGIDHYWKWFDNEEYLKTRINSIILIGHQESLDDDFLKLKKILDLPGELSLPVEEKKAQRAPVQSATSLEDEARKNLRSWYSQDYDLIDLLQVIEKSQLDT